MSIKASLSSLQWQIDHKEVSYMVNASSLIQTFPEELQKAILDNNKHCLNLCEQNLHESKCTDQMSFTRPRGLPADFLPR